MSKVTEIIVVVILGVVLGEAIGGMIVVRDIRRQVGAIPTENYTRDDCATIRTLAQMVLWREKSLNWAPRPEPIMDKKITERCRLYGVEMPTETR